MNTNNIYANPNNPNDFVRDWIISYEDFDDEIFDLDEEDFVIGPTEEVACEEESSDK